MSEALFNNLKKVGIDEATAYEVSNAMNPERYATRQDLLEAIAAHREDTQKTVSAIHQSISAHREETQKKIAAHEKETQKNIANYQQETQKTVSSINRHLLLFFIPVMVTLIGILIPLWK